MSAIPTTVTATIASQIVAACGQNNLKLGTDGAGNIITMSADTRSKSISRFINAWLAANYAEALYDAPSLLQAVSQFLQATRALEQIY